MIISLNTRQKFNESDGKNMNDETINNIFQQYK